jgi:hypothetical protein
MTNMSWECTGLSPETLYHFRVKAWNNEAIETAWCDLGTVRTLFVDSDSDGLPDTWETSYFRDLSQGPGDDYDHDGRTNLEEYESGTIPINSSSFFDITDIKRNPDQSISVFWNCVSGKKYRVIYSNDNMGAAMTWYVAQDNIVAGITGSYEWIDNGTYTGSPPSTVQHRYYRVVVYGPYD